MGVRDEAGVAPFAEEGVGYGLDEGGGLEVCGGGLKKVRGLARLRAWFEGEWRWWWRR